MNKFSSSVSNFTFTTISWKRFVGITQAKQKLARETGIPTTKSGVERKIGAAIVKMIFGK